MRKENSSASKLALDRPLPRRSSHRRARLGSIVWAFYYLDEFGIFALEIRKFSQHVALVLSNFGVALTTKILGLVLRVHLQSFAANIFSISIVSTGAPHSPPWYRRFSIHPRCL
jgi:hypothetical protein